jgi:hypothetical protein
MALVKYAIFAAGGGLWLNGLIGQLDSAAGVGKYLAISAAMALVTLL